MLSRHAIRIIVFAVATLYLAIAASLFAGFAPVRSLWPWPEPDMSYVFLSSIAVAVAAPLFWIGVTGEFAALAPLSLNALVVHASAVIFVTSRIVDGDRSLWIAAALGLVQALVALLLLRWSRRIPTRDSRPTPGVVRAAFVVFTVLLLVVGTLLVLQRPRIFPWNLAPETSTIFGLLFLGASTFFAYGVAWPRWAFAAGQLWGFLAYDVVLLIPYGRILTSGPGAFDAYGGSADAVNTPSLVVYLCVLLASAALAIYMFAFDRRTRVSWRNQQTVIDQRDARSR